MTLKIEASLGFQGDRLALVGDKSPALQSDSLLEKSSIQNHAAAVPKGSTFLQRLAILCNQIVNGLKGIAIQFGINSPPSSSAEEKYLKAYDMLKVDINRSTIAMHGKLVTACPSVCLRDPNEGAKYIDKLLGKLLDKQEKTRVYDEITQGGMASIIIMEYKAAEATYNEQIEDLEKQEKKERKEKKGDDLASALQSIQERRNTAGDARNKPLNMNGIECLSSLENENVENYVCLPDGRCKKRIYNYRTDRYTIEDITEEEFQNKKTTILNMNKMFSPEAYKS